ncbi:MAG: hypothetical protein E5X67_21030 [Mesorhizobium sp.]|uniref:hypothetical protein n=1 Tax=Mesorhizobium sp. TaxID=1871066 RepID=UPI0011FBC94A|nr:hypothetical protein [Mesorhizobium sp.]TIP26247.1 MAG: hypothetical protein E5X67_21030 [Mesorhizobium sp.]
MRQFLPALEDWPTRDQALAIIGALGKMEEGRSSELDRLSGIPDALIVAGRCYAVYGYRELEGGNLASRMAELYMRPRKATLCPAIAPPEADNTPAPPVHSYGLQPRR